jgi:N-acetylglucosaminyldiphosphoundecaprenol N-acetyl-beta-D-mannosaminyltransferase
MSMPVPMQTLFPEPVEVWGLPLSPFTFDETLDAVDRLIEVGDPSFFITANLHYAMLCDADPRLAEVNRKATFIVADGMPLVLASRQTGRPVPERVAGSDLVPALCRRAAEKDRSVFLLGGAPGVAADAGRVLEERFPGLRVVGAESPPYRPATQEEHEALAARIRAAAPDMLFVAFGQPKGELWLAEHCEELGVPVCAQIGATLDMLTGRVKRAPRWVQRVGMEWAWRIGTEPRRLAPRYAADARFLWRKMIEDAQRKSLAAVTQ